MPKHPAPRQLAPHPVRVTSILVTIVALLALTARPALAGFEELRAFGTGAQPLSIAVADLNGDARPDFAVANVLDSSVGVLLNTTSPGAVTPAFAPQVPFATGASPQAVIAADLNGDGKLDLAVASASSTMVSVLMNTTPPGGATAGFSIPVQLSIAPGPSRVAAGDLNGDGKPDLAVTSRTGDSVSVLLNITVTGATIPAFALMMQFAAGDSPAALAMADLNGDTRPDLAIANPSSDTVSVLLNATPVRSTAAAFASPVAYDIGNHPSYVAAADLNGDGKPDLAITNLLSGTVSVLLNATATGAVAPSFTAAASVGTQRFPQEMGVTDLNGDGKPDLAVLNTRSDSVSVMLTRPSGALQLTIPGAAVAEGAGGATVTLARTGSTDGQVSAVLSVTGGTATQGQDYTLGGPQTVTWADGDGANKTVSIPIIPDQAIEGAETIQLTLTLPANRFGATLGPLTSATLTITDDDGMSACIPRPRLTQAVTPGGGGLQVRVESTPLNTSATNPLQQIRFGTFQNATVVMNGQPVSSGQTVSVAPGAVFADFTVRRVRPDQPTTVHITVVDACGEWRTFVGGGTAAGF